MSGVRRQLDATREHGRAALRAVRARPFHLAMAGAVVGLAAGPRAPVVVLACVLVVPVVAGRALVVPVVIAALLGGSLLAGARLAALDRSRLAQGFGHAVVDRVTLLEPVRNRAFGARAAVVGLHGERVLLRAPSRTRWPSARVGAQLAVRGGLRRLGPRDAWLRPRNVHGVIEAETIATTGRARGGPAGVLDGVRERAEAALSRGLPAPQGALLRGMALGQDEALSASTREEFRAAGLSHLVAASGQNVMLLAALAVALSALVGLGLHARLLVVLVLIAAYVPLAGAGPSIQRAGVMGAAGVTAALAGRPAARWYAVLLAAAVTLVANPRAAEEPGWQLSFAAVVAILLVAPPVRERLVVRGAPRGLAEAAALTLAATLGTAPLVAEHFGRTSLVTLPANVLAVPAVAPAMWLGLLAAAMGQVSTALAGPVAALAGFPLAYLGWLAHTAAGLPGAEVEAPPLVVAVVCAGAAAAVVSRRARRTVAPLALAGAALALVVAPEAAAPLPPPASARITLLDVGQGDATLLQHRRTAVLVDTGPPDGGIVGRLRRAGVERLDLLVVTHAQADHDGGAAAVLRAMPVGLVLDGRDGVREPWGTLMAARAGARGVRRVAGTAGQVLRVGRIRLAILWPPRAVPGAHAGDDPNLRALVADVRVGGLRVLLCADAESSVLSGLDLGAVDVLKVAHHGSADEGLGALLRRTRPRLAAIEVGAHNPYGHPAPSTLRALRAARVPTVRTDRDGTVRIEPDGRALRVHPHS